MEAEPGCSRAPVVDPSSSSLLVELRRSIGGNEPPNKCRLQTRKTPGMLRYASTPGARSPQRKKAANRSRRLNQVAFPLAKRIIVFSEIQLIHSWPGRERTLKW